MAFEYHSVLRNPNFQHAFANKSIAVVAPASGIEPTKWAALEAIDQLPVYFSSASQKKSHAYHADSDEGRFEDLINALYDDTYSVIWTLRGGYGSARLLDKLKQCEPPVKEKWIIGFSDNTALHLFFSQCWGWTKTLHGSGFAQLLDLNQSIDNFLRIGQWIQSPHMPQTFSNMVPLNNRAREQTNIAGIIRGGNLTLVESSIGTHWQIDTQNALICLEEVNEKGYRIDRSLNHLKQAGLLKAAKAIIFGCFSGPDQVMIEFALQRFASEIDIPVFKTDLFGHGAVNYPLLIGANGQFEMQQDKIVLTMQEKT